MYKDSREEAIMRGFQSAQGKGSLEVTFSVAEPS